MKIKSKCFKRFFIMFINSVPECGTCINHQAKIFKILKTTSHMKKQWNKVSNHFDIVWFGLDFCIDVNKKKLWFYLKIYFFDCEFKFLFRMVHLFCNSSSFDILFLDLNRNTLKPFKTRKTKNTIIFDLIFYAILQF